MTTPALATTDASGGRVYKVHIGGKDLVLPSVTRIIDQLHRPALENWRQQKIGQAIAADPALRDRVAKDPYRTTQQILAREGGAARLGSTLHSLTVQADRGSLDIDSLAEPVKSTIVEYLKCRERIGWTEVYTEATVVNEVTGYAGALDRILDVPGTGLVVADLKTGRQVYPDVALQLAAYVNARRIWTGDKFENMPQPNDKKLTKGFRTDVAWVIHARPEGCAVLPVDLKRGGGALTAWAVFSALMCLWKWQRRDDVLQSAPDRALADRRFAVSERLRALKNFDGSALGMVAKAWPAGVATFKQSSSQSPRTSIRSKRFSPGSRPG